MIHGMVDRPLVFTMDELKRLPYVSRVHFIECLGNRAKPTHKTVQDTHGRVLRHPLQRRVSRLV